VTPVPTFAISIPQHVDDGTFDPAALRAYLSRAEALGFESAWVQEQVLGSIPHVSPIELMSYAAACSDRLRVGCAVFVTPLYSPVHLAKSLSSLDQLSRGRLDIGVGTGGKFRMFSAFGVDADSFVARFVEGLRLMKALWTEPRATFKGENWQFENVAMEPKPIQKPHPPLWFGARTPIGLKRAVRHSDGWMGAGSSSSADFVQHVSLLRQYCDELKRDPATLPISKRVYLAIDNDKARAEKRLREWFAMRYKNAEMAVQVSLWGSRAEVTDKLGELVKAGAQHLMLNPVFDEMEYLEDLAQNVMPHL